MSAAPFGYEDDDETPEKGAIAVANVHLHNADLPTYSELMEALRSVNDWAAIFAEGHLGRMNNAGKDVDTARALLSRIPK